MTREEYRKLDKELDRKYRAEIKEINKKDLPYEELVELGEKANENYQLASDNLYDRYLEDERKDSEKESSKESSITKLSNSLTEKINYYKPSVTKLTKREFDRIEVMLQEARDSAFNQGATPEQVKETFPELKAKLLESRGVSQDEFDNFEK